MRRRDSGLRLNALVKWLAGSSAAGAIIVAGVALLGHSTAPEASHRSPSALATSQARPSHLASPGSAAAVRQRWLQPAV